MAVVLREIIPDGTKWGTLGPVFPHWSTLEFGQDIKGASSITFRYANDGVNFESLRVGMYVVPIVDGNYQWTDSIFYIEELNSSGATAERATTYSGVSLRSRLEDVRWLPAIGSMYADQGMFRLQNVTPGAVIRNGVENYLSRARRTFNDPVSWISAINDRPVTGWKVRVDELIEPTTSVADMINKYQDLGLATGRFNGFELTISNYADYIEGNAHDKTDEVQLRVGWNLREGDLSISHKELVTALFVRGAADPFKESAGDEGSKPNVVAWVLGPKSAMAKWGYHEKVLDVPDAAQTETLKAVGTAYLNAHLEPRYSKAYTMIDTPYNPSSGKTLVTPKPLRDFECGDRIMILGTNGATTERVYAVTLSYDNPNHPEIGLSLNDFFEDIDVLFNQRLKRLGV